MGGLAGEQVLLKEGAGFDLQVQIKPAHSPQRPRTGVVGSGTIQVCFIWGVRRARLGFRRSFVRPWFRLQTVVLPDARALQRPAPLPCPTPPRTW